MSYRKLKPVVNLRNDMFFEYAADQYNQLVGLCCFVLKVNASLLQELQPDIRAVVAGAIANMICSRNIVYIAEDFEAKLTELDEEKERQAQQIIEKAKKDLQT